MAVCRIVGEPISLDTLGAVTTHYLALADAEELKHECRPVHFTETIEVGGDGAAVGMSFDYQLRSGGRRVHQRVAALGSHGDP